MTTRDETTSNDAYGRLLKRNGNLSRLDVFGDVNACLFAAEVNE